MQELIEELIRALGYAALWMVTLGRYRGGGEKNRLAEGAIGFGIILAIASVVYAPGTP
jgi:hypothetical protein